MDLFNGPLEKVTLSRLFRSVATPEGMGQTVVVQVCVSYPTKLSCRNRSRPPWASREFRLPVAMLEADLFSPNKLPEILAPAMA